MGSPYHLLFAVALILSSSSCATKSIRQSRRTTHLTEQVFVATDSVLAMRLKPDLRASGGPPYWGMKPSTSSVGISQARANELVRILNKVIDRSKFVLYGCVPHPGVQVEFSKGSIRSTVFLCFECVEFQIQTGNVLENGQFEEFHDDLALWAKSVFVGDPEIGRITLHKDRGNSKTQERAP